MIKNAMWIRNKLFTKPARISALAYLKKNTITHIKCHYMSFLYLVILIFHCPIPRKKNQQMNLNFSIEHKLKLKKKILLKKSKLIFLLFF